MEKSSKEVLLNLIRALKADNTKCWQISVDNVIFLITGLLVDCKLILSSDEFDELDDRIGYIQDKLKDAYSKKDSSVFIDFINKALELIEELPNEKSVCDINYGICREHYLDGNSIAIVGDSHVNFFSGNELLNFVSIGHDINYSPQMLMKYPFTCFHMGSCLAYNCCKEGTNSDFFGKMNYLMDEFLIPASKVVLSLGEIDLRCHVFKQTVKQMRSYEQIVKDILDNYFNEVDNILEKGFEVYLWGPIATQKNDCPVGTYFPRVGSETERNMATSFFTKEAEKRCKERNIPFMSIFNKMVSTSFETDDSYISSDKCHLSQSALDLARNEWMDKKLI